MRDQGVLSRKHPSDQGPTTGVTGRGLLIGILLSQPGVGNTRGIDELGNITPPPSEGLSPTYGLGLVSEKAFLDSRKRGAVRASGLRVLGDFGTNEIVAADFLQQKPQSCGLSALRYWLAMHGHGVSEAAIEKRVAGRQHVATATAYERGYSLADLLYAANTFGYGGSARWLFKSSVAHLEFPLIILLNGERQPHFLVLLDNRMAFDPATGYREMAIKTLLEDSVSSVVALHLSAIH
jgi:hypothetical protein